MHRENGYEVQSQEAVPHGCKLSDHSAPSCSPFERGPRMVATPLVPPLRGQRQSDLLFCIIACSRAAGATEWDHAQKLR